MTTRIVAAASYRRMPWKNGGGETFEVGIYPEGAGLEDLGWRVSLALVSSDGPFSAFPGIDRTIAVVEGAGMELSTAECAPWTLSSNTAPRSFAGDVSAQARLTDGPVTDLNVMTRRGLFTHSVQRIALTGPLHLPAREGWTFVVCGRGRLRDLRGGRVLDENDTMVREGADAIDVEPADNLATVFLIHIGEELRAPACRPDS